MVKPDNTNFVSDSIKDHVDFMINHPSKLSRFKYNFDKVTQNGIEDLPMQMWVILDKELSDDIERLIVNYLKEKNIIT